MQIFIALCGTTKVPSTVYHGTKSRFKNFSEYRPAFFSGSIDYAKEYGHIIWKVRLDIKHLFDTRTDKRAVEIYNDYFIPSGLARPGTKPIKLGQAVHMNYADELWSYLAVPEYPAPHYDGIAVSESGVSALHAKFKDADIAFVPLLISQIHLVE